MRALALPLADSFWFPQQGSAMAVDVDRLFYAILTIAAVFFIGIVTLMVWFVVRYRQRDPREKAPPSASHSTALEVTWTAVPVILVIFIFYYGFRIYMDMRITPKTPYEVHVTAQKWSWLFTYKNGVTDGDLHVPLNEPLKLILTSEDVIHSLFIPDFRLKLAAVPGKYSQTWFTATQPGEHLLVCAEYCGTQHSQMQARVIVHPPGEFERWLEDAGNLGARLSPAEWGRRLYQTQGCAQCHSLDGSARVGPSFQGLGAKSEVLLSDGSQVAPDENYLRESIVDPGAKVVAGYQAVMPTFKGRLSDKEITALIEFLKAQK